MTWALLSIALLLSFLLSGLESAVLSVSRVRLRHQAKEKERAAVRLERIFKRRDALLASILLLNNTLNILVFAVGTQKLVDHIGDWGYAISALVSLPIYLFLLELFPKSLFKRFPYRALRRCLALISIIYYTVVPFMIVGPMISKRLRRKKGAEAVDREEFVTLTNIIEREGKLGSYERQMIQNVLDFNRVTAGDVMIPLNRVTAIPLEMPVSAAIELARETRLDQFPVMSSRGELVGIFSVFEVLRKRPASGQVLQYLNRLVRTQPGEKAVTIIRRLRRSGVQLAAVYSAEGRPLGIVSAGDLVARMLLQPR